jgi:2-methylcitrate dehydratase PrpD
MHAPARPGTAERCLADVVTTAGPGTWSPRQRELGVVAIADTLAVGVAGMAESQTAQALATVPAGSGPVPLWRGHGRYSGTDAAFVSGVAAHSLDWDDYMHPMHGHCSSVLLAAVWGLVESRHGTGADLLTAFLAGYQVDYLASLAFGTTHYERGWHATSTVGTLGAAAAAATVLGLDGTRTSAALAIAASLASGLRVNFGSPAKAVHAGASARGGVHAALLAAGGATGNDDWLTGRHGMLATFGAERGPDAAVAAIGAAAAGGHGIETEWGLVQKPYCCCGSCHAAVDAVIELSTAMRATPDTIERIEVHVDPLVPDIMAEPYPRDRFSARYCLPWVMAVAASDRAAGPAQFADDALTRPDVRSLAERVVIIGDLPTTDRDRFAARVTLHDSGRTLEREVSHASGHPANPMTTAQRVAKQRTALTPVLGEAGAGKVIDAVAALDAATPLSTIGDLIRGSTATVSS